MHQEPNFEGNFEIRCAGNACISIFVRSMNASEPKIVVLHRPSVHFGLGTVSCGNALLPSGRNVTSTNTGEAATIRQPEEHPGRLMAIC